MHVLQVFTIKNVRLFHGQKSKIISWGKGKNKQQYCKKISSIFILKLFIYMYRSKDFHILVCKKKNFYFHFIYFFLKKIFTVKCFSLHSLARVDELFFCFFYLNMHTHAFTHTYLKLYTYIRRVHACCIYACLLLVYSLFRMIRIYK